MARKPHTALVNIAAIGSVLAASSCCLPVLPFVMAAGFAGGSAFLSAARTYLLGASILLIAFGFYQAWREKKCERRPSRISAVVLWVSTLFRGDLDLLSAGDGQRGGRPTGPVNR